MYVLEHDPDVIAYWDQPEQIKISYSSRNGHRTSSLITPDYLVVRNDGVEFIEAKMDEALPELALDKPDRFVLGENGKWHSPPAEATARAYGFSFRIWTPSEVDSTWLRNIKYLQDYFDADPNVVPAAVKTQLIEAVTSELGLSLAELRHRFQTASLDHINKLTGT